MSNDMITKYEAKNTIAVKHGYKDWVELKLNNDDESREMYLDKAMDLYAEQSNSHKHGVMQAEGSDGVSEAAVGQRSVGTNAKGRHCGTCKYAESDNPYPCGACSGDYSLWEAPSGGHL